MHAVGERECDDDAIDFDVEKYEVRRVEIEFYRRATTSNNRKIEFYQAIIDFNRVVTCAYRRATHSNRDEIHFYRRKIHKMRDGDVHVVLGCHKKAQRVS